jgi:cytochrome c oxidase assembly protein subunit 15
VVVATILQALWLALKGEGQSLVGSAVTLAVLALLQATLGVWTLLLAVPIELGLAHQAGAIVVFAAALYHFWLTLHGAPQAKAQTASSA